ncbi:MAG: hypothetical protein A2W99_04040 [Bacteroidetes bacterium GWF2_33_16]|nr:MAG: hypothetical protein A2X00_07255 [Bacteroidetes bacterium GWE2_32_14]OFY02963.1 MAG: hypothetical protein A2W99_04040 [Bacteroidetes bacterium GWF2_33_16]
MRKVFWLILIYLLYSKSISAQDIEEYYFKFTIDSKVELTKITQIISIDNVRGTEVFAYANKDEFEEFKKLGYKIDILQKDIPKALTMATTVGEMANWDRYPTYEVYQQMMRNFQLNFPSICKLDSIGTSINGRQLYVIKISDNVTNDEAEPEFYYTSTIHGDETTGYILMLRLIDSLLTTYSTSADIANLVNNSEIFINPNSNPDGTYRGGNSTVSGATRSNANNKDLNRDYPDPRIGANSPYQPENIAMMNYVGNRYFVMSANFHGGAEVTNYPWDTWTSSQNSHSDAAWFSRICTNYVATARTVYANYMKDVTSSGVTEGGDWYVITGGRQDYMTYWRHCREVTMEISSTKLLGTEYLNNYWNYNKLSLINYIRESTYGIRGFVKDTDGNPLKAMIFVNDYDQSSDSSMVFSGPVYGDYYRPLNSGTYSLTASKYGYVPKTINSIVLAANSSVTADFVLEKDVQYSITGQIINGLTGNPIENVSVSITNAPIESSLSNVLGNYSINNIIAGTYYIKLSKNNYSAIIDTITINSDNLLFDFALFPAIIEDFELGNFNKLDWQFSGNANWTIDNEIEQEGLYSAKSGIIGNSSSTTLSVNIDVIHGGFMSFYRKVSSESGFDFLRFYVDDILKYQWSGTQDWAESTYFVNEGLHNFKWIYSKDGNTASGSDCAWIDYISFPYTNINDTSILITPTAITDTLVENESITHSIVIENKGISVNRYNAAIENPIENSWISINKTNDSIDFGSRDTLLVTVTNQNLQPGFYSTNISITENDNDIYTILVSILIPDTLLAVLPLSISDTLFMQESSIHKIVLLNTGTFTNNYSSIIEYASQNEWIHINKTYGSISKSQTDTIILTLTNNYLNSGNYSTNIIITEDDNDTYILPINLYIPNYPDTSLIISPLSIYDTLLTSSDSLHKLVIYNSGTGNNIYSIVIDNKDENSWINLSKEVDTIFSHAFDTVWVSLSNVSLIEGNYTCQIRIIEDDNDNYLIPVYLNVPLVNGIDFDEDLNRIEIYPNPFGDILKIDLLINNPGNIELRLYDLLGNIIKQRIYLHMESGNRYLTLESLHNLTPGIYILKLYYNSRTYSFSVLKN